MPTKCARARALHCFVNLQRATAALILLLRRRRWVKFFITETNFCRQPQTFSLLGVRACVPFLLTILFVMLVHDITRPWIIWRYDLSCYLRPPPQPSTNVHLSAAALDVLCKRKLNPAKSLCTPGKITRRFTALARPLFSSQSASRGRSASTWRNSVNRILLFLVLFYLFGEIEVVTINAFWEVFSFCVIHSTNCKIF